MTRVHRVLASAFVLVAFTACGGTDTARDDVGMGGAPGSTAEPAAAPAPGATPGASMLRVTDVALGRQLRGDTAVVDEVDDFRPNDTIYAVVRHEGGAAGAQITARWTFEDGQVVDERTETVSPTGAGTEYTRFQISNPSGWPPGNYRLTILVDGQEVESEDFEVGRG